MRILLTNDDGINAPGIRALYRAVRDLGDVHVVAPAGVESCASHSVTFHRAVRAVPHSNSDLTGWAVEGRPADCVKLALSHLIPMDRGIEPHPDCPPVDLCISGMNSGANIGINVMYSGTVAAATEATFLGVPAIAVSLHIADFGRTRWDAAAEHAAAVIRDLLGHKLDPHTVLNLNVPVLDDTPDVRGLKVCPVGTSPLVDAYEVASDAPGGAGGHTFEVVSSMAFRRDEPGTDTAALFDRWITLTPLHFQRTCRPSLDRWRERCAEGRRSRGAAST